MTHEALTAAQSSGQKVGEAAQDLAPTFKGLGVILEDTIHRTGTLGSHVGKLEEQVGNHTYIQKHLLTAIFFIKENIKELFFNYRKGKGTNRTYETNITNRDGRESECHLKYHF
jgi:hypothetical protein